MGREVPAISGLFGGAAPVIILGKGYGVRSGTSSFSTGGRVMLLRARRLLVPALVVVWLGLAAPVNAVFPPPVKDEGKFFSAEAVDKANKKIKEIYSKSRKDLVIETYASVPEGKKVPEDPKKRAEFFDEWARSRSEELGVNGIYVLICKKPTQVRIEVDRRSRRAFTKADAERLVKRIVGAFRENKFDDGLLGGTEVVEAALKASSK
jgi:uncharacterized membrane protein YgcG